MDVLKIQEYLEKIKEIYSTTINFLEEKEDKEENFNNLIKFFDDKKIRENRYDIQVLLYILSSISCNHQHTSLFMSKIKKILLFYKDLIKQTFSNDEIFDIFKNNKRILLILFKENLINIDKTIFSLMMNDKYKNKDYPQFFSIEINQFNHQENSEVNLSAEEIEKKREIGENDSVICELIRNDSIEEFISYVQQNNVSLSSTINHSIFETNSFLIKNKTPSLIEYAAFYGSIQIFNYLQTNKVELTPSLWFYSIHSNNIELIHILEKNHVTPADKTYQKCLKESIKCHHNDLANYFKKNLLDKTAEKNNLKSNFNENTLNDCFHYYNFLFLSPQLIHRFTIYYACKYGYFTLVTLFLKLEGIDINSKII